MQEFFDFDLRIEVIPRIHTQPFTSARGRGRVREPTRPAEATVEGRIVFQEREPLFCQHFVTAMRRPTQAASGMAAQPETPSKTRGACNK